MTGSERDAQVQERADRLLSDGRAVAAYARFADAQLRCRGTRGMPAGLRALARVVMVVTVALVSAGAAMSPVPGPWPARVTAPGSAR